MKRLLPDGYSAKSLTFVLTIIIVGGISFSGLHHVLPRYASLALLLAFSAFLYVSSGDFRLSASAVSLFGLVAAYAVRAFGAASVSLAADRALLLLALAALWMAFRQVGNDNRVLGWAIVASALLMAVVNTVGLGSISLTYSNADGSWLMLGFLLAVSMAVNASSKVEAVLLAGTAPLIGGALLLTGSRGAWIAGAIAAVIGLWLLRHRLATYIGVGIYTAFASLMLAGLLLLSDSWWSVAAVVLLGGLLGLGFVYLSTKGKKWTALLAGLVLLLATVLAVQRFNLPEEYALSNASENARFRQIVFQAGDIKPGTYTLGAVLEVTNTSEAASAGTLSVWAMNEVGAWQRLLLVTAVNEGMELHEEFTVADDLSNIEVRLVNSLPGTGVRLLGPYISGESVHKQLSNPYHSLLPYEIAIRVERMTPEILRSDGRIEYLKDARKLFAERPWLGYGGGNWAVRMPGVQETYYEATLVLSDPVEVALDVGIVGFTLYAGFLLMVLVPVYFAKKRSDISKAYAAAATGVIVHSFGEALLGYPTIYLALFALLGVISAEQKPVWQITSPWFQRGLAAVMLLGAVVAGSFALSERYGQGAADEARLRRAVAFNPFQADFRLELARVIARDADRWPEAESHVLKVLKHEPFNAAYAAQTGQLYLNRHDYDRALELYLKAVDLQPRLAQNYNNAIHAAAYAADVLHAAGLRQASYYAEHALGVLLRHRTAVAQLPQSNATQLHAFALSPEALVDIGRSLSVLGRHDEARPYLMELVRVQQPYWVDGANRWLGK